MGYFTLNGITRYDPDNTPNTLYIQMFGSLDFDSLREKIKEHFGDPNLDNYEISTEYIHTDCIGYDLYDSSDWSIFIIIERKS